MYQHTTSNHQLVHHPQHGGGTQRGGVGGTQGNNNSTNNNTSPHWDGALIICNHCIRPITDRRNVLAPCHHVFCYPCAQEQFALAPECPVCKVTFDPSKDVRCISTTDTDAKEQGKRLCTFTPRQLVDAFSYALKFWQWQQHLTTKLTKNQSVLDHGTLQQQYQQLKLRINEIQQTSNELTTQNQLLSNTNQKLQLYIKQLEQQLQHEGSALPKQHSNYSSNISHQQCRSHPPTTLMTRTPVSVQTPAFSHTNTGFSRTSAPFTPFASSSTTRSNVPTVSQNHHHYQTLPTSTPATFGVVLYKDSSRTSGDRDDYDENSHRNNYPPQRKQHTNYSNGTINGTMTPITPGLGPTICHESYNSTRQTNAQQPININPSNILGQRGKTAQQRQLGQNNH